MAECQLHAPIRDMRRNQFCTLNLFGPASPLSDQTAAAHSPTRKRLAEGFAYLEVLTRERAHGRNPVFRRFMEWRIIRRELLELEAQAADEQIERIPTAAREHTD
jgi:hypothetical protein